MNHSKVLAVSIAAAMLMGVATLTASACNIDMEENLYPCEMALEKGYCDKEILRHPYLNPDTGITELHQIVNPYYDKEKILQAAQEAAEQEQKAESESTDAGSAASFVSPVKETPELPLADVVVPVVRTKDVPYATSYDLIRISHAVAQETVIYEGEPMELYSVYPYAAVWKTWLDEYSPMKFYKATLENGTLIAGELEVDSEVEEPMSRYGYLYWNEDAVGNYYIAEIGGTFFTQKIGIHVVEGTLPENVPVQYIYDVGISQHITSIEGDITAVPVGTVITLPYDTADGRRYLLPSCACSMDPFPTRDAALNAVYRSGANLEEINYTYVEPYLSNGRESFTVESGRMYHITYMYGVLDPESPAVGVSQAHVFIMADDCVFPTDNTAYASTQTVDVDGKEVTFECYALKDENGNLSNYIKLRDLALLLNGSAAQFQVGWDGSITITTNTAYTPNGSELATPYTGDRTYQETTTGTKVNGYDVDLAAFVLNDDNGGGYTYYQLRDLGKVLGFNVGWSADKGIFVETNQPYDPAN